MLSYNSYAKARKFKAGDMQCQTLFQTLEFQNQSVHPLWIKYDYKDNLFFENWPQK